MKNLFVPFTNGPINKRENPEWNRRAPINFYHLVLCFSFSWAWISMNQKSMVYTTIQYNASNKYSCIILYAKKTEMENKQNSNWIRWLLITVIIFVNLKVMARNLANGWKIFSLQNIPPGQRRPWLKWWLIFNAMLCFAFPIAISMKNDERSLCVCILIPLCNFNFTLSAPYHYHLIFAVRCARALHSFSIFFRMFLCRSGFAFCKASSHQLQNRNAFKLQTTINSIDGKSNI